MQLDSLTMQGFRCFGSEPVTLDFDGEVTALVGANAAGKTAVLFALQRMFGDTRDARRILRDDFHVPPTLARVPRDASLLLEAVFSFPGTEVEDGELLGVADFFNQMTAERDGRLILRIRLLAELIEDGTTDGFVEAHHYVVLDDEDAEDGERLVALNPHDRGRVLVRYVPPSRDGARAAQSLLRRRFLGAAQWGEQFKSDLEGRLEEVEELVVREEAAKRLVGTVKKRWLELHDGEFDVEPRLALAQDVIDALGRLELLFAPTEQGGERAPSELSDGQRSLLHVAMVAAAIDIEAAAEDEAVPFDADIVGGPGLTIIALEEPENNLSPYYLARSMRVLHSVCSGPRAQAVVSTHSPSVVRRVDPQAIRYMRRDRQTGRSIIRRITLPDDEDATKFLLGAVWAHPELYFAKVVILGEGDSEVIALPLLARAMDIDLDPSFAAVVRLGGRHVDHMWRLLDGLDIPYVTLLDLDRGRQSGGIARLKYAADQLVALGRDPIDEHVDLVGTGWANRGAIDVDHIDGWKAALQARGVFFCAPIDLDWSLMVHLQGRYRATSDGEPGDADAAQAVFGSGDYEEFERLAVDDEDMRWYRYLFITGSKPATHLAALTSGEPLIPEDVPEDIAAALTAVKDHLVGAKAEDAT